MTLDVWLAWLIGALAGLSVGWLNYRLVDRLLDRVERGYDAEDTP